jgi:hypothetical protein
MDLWFSEFSSPHRLAEFSSPHRLASHPLFDFCIAFLIYHPNRNEQISNFVVYISQHIQKYYNLKIATQCIYPVI